MQHNIRASSVLAKTVSVKGLYMALIQDSWYREGFIRGLNIPGYTLFSASRIGRPRACILTRNETSSMLPGFFCRDLIAVLIKYNDDGAERWLVLCSAYTPYDSEDPSPLKEKRKDLTQYCENENLYLVVVCDPNPHHIERGSTNCNNRGEALMEFLNSSYLVILNQGNKSTFCSGGKLEVIDITLGSFGHLESIIGWEVSTEPSLSDFRHILFTLHGYVPVRPIRNPRGTK